MVALQQIQETINLQRRQLEQARKQSQQITQQVSEKRRALETQQFLRNLTRQKLISSQLARRELGKVTGKVSERNKILSNVEARIRDIEPQIRQVAEEQSAFNVAKKLFDKGVEGIVRGKSGGGLVAKFIEQLERGRENAIKSAIKRVEKNLQQTLIPEVREKIRTELLKTKPGAEVDITDILSSKLSPIKEKVLESLSSKLSPIKEKVLESKLPDKTVITEFKPLTKEEIKVSKKFERKAKLISVFDFLKEKGKILESGIPAEEEGIAGLTEKIGRKIGFRPIPKIPEPTAVEGFILEPTKRDRVPTGTEIKEFTTREKTFFEKEFTTREKTFFENLGINPNDKDSINFKTKVETIQEQFDRQILTKENANKQLQKAQDEFTSKQIIKGVPESAAYGAGFGIIASIPVVGTAASALLAGDVLLKRRHILSQFKKFPVESALSTGAFLAGGLATSSVIKGVKTGLKPEVGLENIESVTKLGGKTKVKLISKFAELDSGFKISAKTGKITDTLAYDILLKDGTRFRVLEFTNLKAPGGATVVKGTREFVGFEVSPKIQARIGGRAKVLPRELIAGRAVQIAGVEKGETFVRVIKFKPANTKIGRLSQKLFGGGKVFDIVERSKVVGTKGGLRRRVTQVESQARVLEVRRLKGNLLRQVLRVEKKIKEGKRLSFSELKTIFNLERRLEGKEPFTELEWRKSGFRTVSDISIVTLFNFFKKVRQSTKIKEMDIVTLKETVGGIIRTRPELTPKLKIPKKKISEKVNTLSDVRRNINRIARDETKIGKQILKNKKQFQQAINRVKTIPSSAVALAVSIIKKQETPFRKLVTRQIVTNIAASAQLQSLSQIQREVSLQAQSQRSQILQATVPLTAQRSDSLLKVSQQLDSRLRQIQLQRQQLIQISRSSSKFVTRRPPTPRFRVPPPFIGKVTELKQKRRLIDIAKEKKKGWFVLYKRRGKFIQINKNPLNKQRASSLGAFVTDHSLARSFKLKESRKPAQKKSQFKFPPNYFSNTSRKWRPAKKQRGVIVEKRRFALDTLRERKKIQAARFLSQIKKSKIKSTTKIKKLPSPFIRLKRRKK